MANLEVFDVVTKLEGASCLCDITCKKNDSELQLRRQKRGVFHQIWKHCEQGWRNGESTRPPPSHQYRPGSNPGFHALRGLS